MEAAEALSQRTLGPITLSPGVEPKQIFVFLCVIIAAICMLLFMPLMQAFVFTEMLHLPKGEQGRMAGNLTTVQQIAILIFVGLTGGLADRLGRKAVLIMALLGYSTCLILYPLATGVLMLFVLQFLFGMASTGHTVGGATMMVDYPDNKSRGKFIGLMLVIQGLATAFLVGWVGSRLPGWLVATGIEPADAGRYVFWAMACLGVIGASIAALYLKNVKAPQRPVEGHRGLAESLRTMRGNYKKVLAHARTNPRFGLVMLMGFVIRSDYAVINSFLALWVIHSAGAQGVTSVVALKTAGLLTGIFQIASLAAPPLFGFLADRINRTVLLVAALAATGCALATTFLINDVFGYPIMIVVACIGVTESALIIGAQSVFGEEVQAEIRGSAMGIFAFLGTVSAVIISFTGGFMFDKVGYFAPFVLVGSLNLIFAAIGSTLVLRHLAASKASAATSTAGSI